MEELLHTSQLADLQIGVYHEIPPHGGVVLKRYMGSDATVVEAARTSYQKGTKVLRSDEGLIHYMAGRRRDKCTACHGTGEWAGPPMLDEPGRMFECNTCRGKKYVNEHYTHPHTSPFEQVVMQFWIKLPIFLERQMVRHRTARLNEMSGRYSEMPDEYWYPHDAEEIPRTGTNGFYLLRGQDTKNKQGSKGLVEVPMEVYTRWLNGTKEAHAAYLEMLKCGVAKELARAHLPLSLYTQKVWQMDLNNLSRYLMLRLDSHTQIEHQVYARILAFLAWAVAPIATEALARSQGWHSELTEALRINGVML